MFLFDRSLGAAVAGLAVALLFVCFDRACQVPEPDAGVAQMAVATPAEIAPAAAALPLVAAPVTDRSIAVCASATCPPPAAWGTLRAGS